ncbi:hypothetical protein LUZ61_020398 [Rhynchospora tenuis]|uniref:Phenylalanine ammonia-lyase n=1 Tax=Rhynchospora tenuis TaxID=198213 RepID=A0AAD6ENS2_9POAL|nr:hypothetical protein LUZ61_020398 [Rhynchospora tenuis]
MASSSENLTTNSCISHIPESTQWKAAAEAMSCTFSEEVHRMVTHFSNLSSVNLDGTSLTIGQVTAIARCADILISLDEDAARARVDSSFSWMGEKSQSGTGTHGVTTGFGSTSNRRTNKTSDLQSELIRFLNAGVIVKEHLPVSHAKAAILVRTNMLMKGYSSIRWDLLEAMTKLMNSNLIPKLPLRGTISGDLLPLSYVAGVLTGRQNCKVLTPEGEEILSTDALKRIGIEAPFDLQAKEGLALVNGTSVGAAMASTVCYDANIIGLLSIILSAMFCELMKGDPQFTDPLSHNLKHHPGQIESASIMKFLLDGSEYMKDSLPKTMAGRYALRTSPQWLGPQIEVIRFMTHAIEREINSVNDNPLIDVSRDMSVRGGNFQGTPIDVSMDTIRVALAAIGKLAFAQFSELVCDYYNNGLPTNLSAGKDPSLDYGLKGAEVAMAAYCSELQYLANPMITHVQSAEQHNQDVNSLGLISARMSAEAIELLQLMMATYLVGLCQAIDLRHLEENLHKAVKQVVLGTAENMHPFFKLYKENLIRVVDRQPVFSYVDDPGNPDNKLISQLRDILVQKAFKGGEDGAEALKMVPKYQEELIERLEDEVAKAREQFAKGDYAVGMRIKKCKTYPVYRFVREEVGTEMLTGEKNVSPGEYIEKVYDAIKEGKIDGVIIDCIASWNKRN